MTEMLVFLAIVAVLLAVTEWLDYTEERRDARRRNRR